VGLFGLLKKKEKQEPQVPKPLELTDLGKKLMAPSAAARHKDDLEKPTPALKGPLFPEIPKLELPELEAPEEKEEKINLDGLKLPEIKLTKEQPKKEEKLELPELETEEVVPLEFPEKEEELPGIELPEELDIPEALPELEDFEYRPKKQKPVFININKYNQMIDQLNKMKTKLTDYSAISSKIVQIKDSKDKALEKYRQTLEEIERKLLYVDKTFFEGG